MRRNHPERTDHKRLSRPERQYELHRDGLPLRMSDGVRLSADLYLPSGPGPWPVLLERTPYNKEASVEVSQVGSPEYFAIRGYAVVIQDTRGRFNSEGEFYPFRDDGWGENRDGLRHSRSHRQPEVVQRQSRHVGRLIRRAHPVRHGPHCPTPPGGPVRPPLHRRLLRWVDFPGRIVRAQIPSRLGSRSVGVPGGTGDYGRCGTGAAEKGD